MMKTDKRRKLETAGWRVEGTREFLELTPGEAELVEIKLRDRRELGRLAPALKGRSSNGGADPPPFR